MESLTVTNLLGERMKISKASTAAADFLIESGALTGFVKRAQIKVLKDTKTEMLTLGGFWFHGTTPQQNDDVLNWVDQQMKDAR